MLLSLYWAVLFYNEMKTHKEGYHIIEKIQNFQRSNRVLPETLSEIDIIERENSKFHYKKIDSFRYMIWCGNILGESETYYSDSKKWEKHQK